MGLNIPIIQVVGYQNSGKTTLIEKIVANFAEAGQRVGTIKHHGHGGELVSLDVGKDSHRHRQAGAVVTTVEGGGALQLQAAGDIWKLPNIITIYEQFNLRLIVVEGFKDAPYQKIVIIREEKDLDLLTALVEIKAVITWIPLSEEIAKRFQVFSINEDHQFFEWINKVVRDFYE